MCFPSARRRGEPPPATTATAGLWGARGPGDTAVAIPRVQMPMPRARAGGCFMLKAGTLCCMKRRNSEAATGVVHQSRVRVFNWVVETFPPRLAARRTFSFGASSIA